MSYLPLLWTYSYFRHELLTLNLDKQGLSVLALLYAVVFAC